MRVKTTQTVTKEKDIELPYFFKISYSHIKPTYFAVFSEDKAMRIRETDVNCTGAEAVTQFITDESASQITEAEFNEAFEVTMGFIMQYVPQAA
jgi:hypothetical protein